MKISVVIPVYKTEKYLKRCVDSILNQTYNNTEIILIDDGSPDNSLAIIEEYANNNSNVKYFSTENRGLSAARNLGFENATGDYIIFIDSDDYAAINMFERLIEEITKNNCDVAICNIYNAYDDFISSPVFKMPKTKIIENKSLDFIISTFKKDPYLGNCVYNKLYNLKFLRETGLKFTDTSEVYAEDAYFYYMVVSKIKKIVIVDEPLYYYYQRPGSIMNTYKTRFDVRITNFIKGIDDYYKNYNYYHKIKKAISVMSLDFLIEILYNNFEKSYKYIDFKSLCKNKFFRDVILKANTKSFKDKKKIIFFFYKYKLYFLNYIILLFYKKYKRVGV